MVIRWRCRLVPILAALLAPFLVTAAKKTAPEWPPISEEERALKSIPQDPEADAVILLHTRDGRILEEGRYYVNVLDYHWRLKVLNERGKRHAEVHIPAGKYSRVSNIEARTVKQDGAVVPVASDQIFEKLVQKVGGYEQKEFVFSFPAVEPGAIVEYRYVRHDDNLVFIDPWFFAGPEFTRLSRVSQSAPGGAHYTILCDRCPDPEPEHSDWSEGKARGRRHTLQMRDVPAEREEMLMPPEREVSPRVEMVLRGWEHVSWEALGRDGDLFTDWTSVGRYALYSYKNAYKVDEADIRKVVADWLQGVSDPQERIKSIFRHVQSDFRYVRYSEVIGRSRSIATLLKDRTADNEEKAVLLVAALRAIGLEPQIALVCGKHKGGLYTNFPSLSHFSHAVVALPQEGGSFLWLDPTVTYAPFGFMPWQDSGAAALLIKEGQAQVFTLPQKGELNVTRYRIIVTPRPDGPAVLDAEAEFQGEDAIEMRDDLAPASEASRTSLLQNWVRENLPGGALRSHTIQDLEAIDRPLRIKMSIEAPGLVTRAEGLLLVRGCVLGCHDSNPISRGLRLHPFYVDRSRNEEQTVTVLAPAGMKAAQMPPPAVAKSAIGSLTLTCKTQEDGSVRCIRALVLPRGRYPGSEQTGVRSMFDKAVEADRTSVAFQESSPATN